MTSRLTYSSLPTEIKKIANESLGLGVLKSLFSYAKTYHLIIKISDGIFIGFALYHFQTKTLRDGSTYTTGIIDCVCVATPYRQEGFGTLLTFSTLRKMNAYGVDRIEILLKKPTPGDKDNEPGVPLVGSEDLLVALGFRKVKTYRNNYTQISRQYGYDCIMCNNRPDTCLGILYAIDSN